MSSNAVITKASPLDVLQRWLPKLVLAPSMVIVLVGFYGYIGWTFLLSFTNSRFMPSYNFVGLQQYARLWDNDRWWVASQNLLVFGGLFIAISLIIGVFLAVLLDQRIRREGFIRTIFLYPMALSMIVTGTAWKWLLNPGLGLDKLLRDWGWEGFRFDWLVDPDRVVYCLVMAAVWQSSGFVMALFLRFAQRRSIDHPCRPGRWRQPAEHLPAHRAAEPGPGVLQRADDPRPYRHQELRPGRLDDRRRARLRLRPAGDVHVRPHLHPRPDGPRRRQRNADARRGAGDPGALPIFRTARQTP